MLALQIIAAVVQIAVGNGHTCALHDNGQVSCWGSNASGELGDGTVEDRLAPTPVVGLDDVVAITAEQHHTCAQRRNGELVCWGELDNATQTGPIAVDDDVVQLSGSCFVTRNHRATCDKEEVADVTDALAVAGNSGSGCVVHASGEVSCWFSPDSPAPVPGVADAVEVAVAGGVACSRDRGGAVWCWQWALEPEKRSARMERMTLPPLMPTHQVAVSPRRVITTGATALAGGFDRVCAVSRGKLRCWGSGLKPARVPALSGVTALALGRHSCAVRGGRDVVCWGANENGQLGNGWAGERTTPLVVPGLKDAVALETSYHTGVVGYQWSCAQRANGKAMCWGNTNPRDPRQANPVPKAAAKTMARRGDCTLTPRGRVRCDYEPVKQWPGHEAPGITDAVQLAMGDMWNCARERAGQVSCWKQATIKRVPVISDAIDIASGSAVCAVRADHSGEKTGPGLVSSVIANARPDQASSQLSGSRPSATRSRELAMA